MAHLGQLQSEDWVVRPSDLMTGINVFLLFHEKYRFPYPSFSDMFVLTVVLMTAAVGLVRSLPSFHNDTHNPPNSRQSSCFPALNFQMPSTVPASISGWWCDPTTEYAFVGFSYEISACQSSSQLNKEFADMRTNFNARYVRLYGACDTAGYYDTIVDAAWNNGLGVHALIWFGFDHTTQWKTRRDDLVNSLLTNPKAQYVTRAIQFGSEPLFDNVLSPSALASEIAALKTSLDCLQIPVTISEMAYALMQNNDAPEIFSVVDLIDAHMLPYFSSQAAASSQAWPLVKSDLDYFIGKANGKKIWLSENGWPSESSAGVQPNSPNAVADVANEAGYLALLDSHCTDFKAVVGGVSWFWHIYSDSQELGYGLYDVNGQQKFTFQPRTTC